MPFNETRVYNRVKSLYEARNPDRVITQSTYNIIQDIAKAILEELELYIKVKETTPVEVSGTISVPSGGGSVNVTLTGTLSAKGDLEQLP